MAGSTGGTQKKKDHGGRWIIALAVILFVVGLPAIDAMSNHGGIVVQKITTEVTFDSGGSAKVHTRYQIKIDQPKWYSDFTFYVSEDDFMRLKFGDALSKDEVEKIRQAI